VTTDYVLGLTVVLADGSAVTLGGPRLKDVAGLSLVKLFVGSEGTLGIVTEAVLRLIPERAAPATIVAVFPDLGEAAQAVIDITRAMRPSMLEFLDRPTIGAVEDERRMGLDRTAAAMIIVQIDEGGAEALAEVERLCTARGASEYYATKDPDEGDAFVEARRAVLPAMERLGRPLIEDVGVPVPRLRDLVLGCERIGAEFGVTVAIVAHAGDGNTHPTLIVDPNDPEQERRVMLAFDAIMRLATELGGTITGEHGVGRLKTAWLRENLGDAAYELNLRVKRALDPQGLFNPGSKFLESELRGGTA
ncbi:MAG: FAD-binding oxidoreductase, partial [Leucobacter sp.]|nr:FAD-binding oxidoreductase [Leucobacter sp.]